MKMQKKKRRADQIDELPITTHSCHVNKSDEMGLPVLAYKHFVCLRFHKTLPYKYAMW